MDATGGRKYDNLIKEEEQKIKWNEWKSVILLNKALI